MRSHRRLNHPVLRIASAALLVMGFVAILTLVSAAPASAVGLSDPGALTVHEGSMTVKQDGAVIENLEIRGTLRIEANNVVVRNVWVYTGSQWTIYVASGSATFDNVEIGHPNIWGMRGIGGSNVVMRNADIHHVEDGIKLASNSHYSGVKVHSLASPSSSPHADCVQVESTASNSSVKNSILDATGPVGYGNAAVIVKSDLGSQKNLTFANNYMNGGNYTIFVRDGGHGMPANVQFLSNRFGRTNHYGLLSSDGAVVWDNNTWADTGELIPLSGNHIGPGGSGSPTTTSTTAAPAPTTTTTKAPAKPSPTTTQPPTTTTRPAPTTTTSTTSTTLAPTTSVSPPTTVDADPVVDELPATQIVASEESDPGADATNSQLALLAILGGLVVTMAVLYFTHPND